MNPISVVAVVEQTAANPAYETDFHAWTQVQAALLRAGRLAELDLKNLVEELESMGASERRELGSRLKVLLQHLLKWQFQPDSRSNSWRGTVDKQRDQLERLLEQSPSLQRLLPDLLPVEYARARRAAILETEQPLERFPSSCPYTLKQMLDPDFWPDAG